MFRSYDLFETHCIGAHTSVPIFCRICKTFITTEDYEEHIGCDDHKRKSSQLRKEDNSTSTEPDPVVYEPIIEDVVDDNTENLVEKPEEVMVAFIWN